jgi:hypothetical protein
MIISYLDLASKPLPRQNHAVIRVYDEAGNAIETHKQAGDFKEPWIFTRIASQFPLRISYKLLRPEKPVIKGGVFGPNYG